MTRPLSGDAIGVVRTSPDERERARRYVAGASRDADDAALLLDALGLLPTRREDYQRSAVRMVAEYESGRRIVDIARERGLNPSTVAHIIHSRTAKRFTPPVAACGTNSGYGRHRDRGEAACQPCKGAHAAHVANFKARKASA